MSFKLMAQALDIKTGSSTTKLVLLKLCDNANDQGECWPSQELIAEQCEMTKRTVISCIKKLEVLGLLEVEKKYKNSNKYIIKVSSANISLVKEIHPSSENASPLSSETVSLPYIEPTNKNLSENLSPKAFEIFWQAYPKKVMKLEAEKAFKKAIKIVSLEVILKGLKTSEAVLRDDKKFIPNAMKWLNGGGWSDESETKGKKKSVFNTWDQDQ